MTISNFQLVVLFGLMFFLHSRASECGYVRDFLVSPLGASVDEDRVPCVLTLTYPIQLRRMGGNNKLERYTFDQFADFFPPFLCNHWIALTWGHGGGGVVPAL